jgi:hypothetical protein
MKDINKILAKAHFKISIMANMKNSKSHGKQEVDVQ